MEKIVKIEEYQAGKGLRTVEGYKVITTNQTITLAIENTTIDRENWGYFWCNDNPKDFIGADLHEIKLTDDALSEVRMEAKISNINAKYFEGRIMFVNFETSKGTLQFVAYNEHNGFYGHTAKIESTQLTHEETL